MAIEAERGCGFRKVGGLYLCGGGAGMTCDRLPYELVVCPVCGGGIKFTRGFTWIDWEKYARDHHSDCDCMNLPDWKSYCPVCFPSNFPQPYGLLWVGESYYTPENFIKEAITMGVSKRIAAIPKNLKLGETWILFAHKKAVQVTVVENISEAWEVTRETVKAPDIDEIGQLVESPGIFYAFRPQQLELLIWKSDATDEKLAELVKKNITPIVIPDGDVDHDPATKLKMNDSERGAIMRTRTFDDLRKIINRRQE